MEKMENIRTLAEKMAELIGKIDLEIAQEKESHEKDFEKKHKND